MRDSSRKVILLLVGVLSDSHDDIGSLERAIEILQRTGVDEIIHLGDLVSPFSLKPIINSGIPFRLLRGNNDAESLVTIMTLENNAKYYPSPAEIELGERKALIFHGFGSKDLTKFIAVQAASSGKYEFVLYGHTHELHIEEVDSSIIINPGEVCGKLTGRKTIVILDTREKDVEVIDL